MIDNTLHLRKEEYILSGSPIPCKAYAKIAYIIGNNLNDRPFRVVIMPYPNMHRNYINKNDSRKEICYLVDKKLALKDKFVPQYIDE